MPIATINLKEIAVTHTVRSDVNREFLTVECPHGWDDVKKLTNKVLTFEGRKFTFASWNSDYNYASFYRLFDQNDSIATIS